MAAGAKKVGVPIVVTYQASKAASGKTIQMDVYDEAQSFTLQSGIMIEIGSTGRYCKSFTPDVEGEWIIMMVDSVSGKGEVVKTFAICGQDLDSVGDKVDTVSGNVDDIKGKTTNLPTDPASATNVAAVESKVDTIGSIVDTMETDIRGTDGDTLKDLSEEIDAISSPAMVG